MPDHDAEVDTASQEVWYHIHRLLQTLVDVADGMMKDSYLRSLLNKYCRDG